MIKSRIISFETISLSEFSKSLHPFHYHSYLIGCTDRPAIWVSLGLELRPEGSKAAIAPPGSTLQHSPSGLLLGLESNLRVRAGSTTATPSTTPPPPSSVRVAAARAAAPGPVDGMNRPRSESPRR